MHSLLLLFVYRNLDLSLPSCHLYSLTLHVTQHGRQSAVSGLRLDGMALCQHLRVVLRHHCNPALHNCWWCRRTTRSCRHKALPSRSGQDHIEQGLTRNRPMANPVVFKYLSYSTTLAEHAVHRLRRCPAFVRARTCLFLSVNLKRD